MSCDHVIRTRFLPPISSHKFLRPVSPPVMGDAATVDRRSQMPHLLLLRHHCPYLPYLGVEAPHRTTHRIPPASRRSRSGRLPAPRAGVRRRRPRDPTAGRAGFAVMGVNVSSSILDIARREVVAADFHLGDMLSFSPPRAGSTPASWRSTPCPRPSRRWRRAVGCYLI